MIFRVKFEKYISTNVKITEYGMAIPMISGLLTFFKKKNRTSMANRPPKRREVEILPIACWI
ncbi:Uncharacterised protein [Mycobacteroides abscessus subsp. abscessus]|nr:Uncharacterised protein [Mycobacteroides abscessus subsp. abscessus]